MRNSYLHDNIVKASLAIMLLSSILIVSFIGLSIRLTIEAFS